MTILVTFTLVFTGNPGALKPIDLNLYLDGQRPTLFLTTNTKASKSTLMYAVYPNGYAGENTDVVPDLCTGVLVSLTSLQLNFYTPSSMTTSLMKCLGGSDGNSNNNVGSGYSWDFGNNVATGTTSYFTNPHLVKLIDATQDLPESMSQAGKNADLEKAAYPNADIPGLYLNPASRKNASTYTNGIASFSYGVYNSEGILQPTLGTSTNADPPGFYMVIVYDGSNFYSLTNAPTSTSTLPYYHVYTTTGYLQLVSPASVVVTMPSNFAGASAGVDSYFSNTLYFAPNLNSASGYFGNVDCESLKRSANYPYSSKYSGSSGALDCLNKGDSVMVLFTEGASSSTLTGGSSIYASRSPAYPDIYTVNKISIQPYSRAVPSHTLDEEVIRRQMVLNYGVNQVYGFNTASPPAYKAYTGSLTTGATGGGSVYKFYPPTGFNYVGECSNRGVCDPVQGMCTCFPGYTSDNCGVPNALAL